MRRTLSLTLFLFATLCSLGQQSADADAEIAERAGIIFRGTVIAVQLESARAPGEIAATRITLRVDEAFRGTSTGQLLTIKQWRASDTEYRVGESLLLFLYSPSTAMGLTSPVFGRAGHLRLEEVPAEILTLLRSSTPKAVRTETQVQSIAEGPVRNPDRKLTRPPRRSAQ